ncbi:MAG: hypothetical protein L2C94_001945 [Aigarchaeota archaeon]|nr:hypothetical protein [Candidatus Wolframiiraptor gerlachensis]
MSSIRLGMLLSAFNVVDGAAAGDARGVMWVAEEGFIPATFHKGGGG